MTPRDSILVIAPPGRLRDGLRVMLQTQSHLAPIRLAGDGASGMRMAAEHSPRLVLLDESLPGGQALGVLSELKGRWPELPCIVLAHTSSQSRHAQAAGADRVLQAGFTADCLLDAIAALVPR